MLDCILFYSNGDGEKDLISFSLLLIIGLHFCTFWVCVLFWNCFSLSFPESLAAIAVLKDKEPGSFIVRDSHSFRGAYGLAMKVATPPPSVLQLNKKGTVCLLLFNKPCIVGSPYYSVIIWRKSPLF